MLSPEKQRSFSPPPLIGSMSTIAAMIEQLSRRTKIQTKTEASTTNFLLIDTFTNELVAPQADLESLDQIERQHRLETTLKTQLESALREHLRTPYHSDANEIEWDQYAAGKLHVFHRHYAQKDLRDHCQEAVEANVGVKRERYAREKKQLDILYTQKILPELENFTDLTPTNSAILSHEIREAYGLSANEEIYVGTKHALVMPANQAVYPDGWSYVNIHQLVYLPKQRRILVTLDQYFAELSYEQHRFLLNRWRPDVIGKQVPLTEKLLMESVVTLPENVKNSSAFSLFIDLAKSLKTNELAIRQKQQFSYAFVEKSGDTLSLAATFLTQILLLEYQVCRQHPEALSTLAQRLNVAFEMAAHPLLSGRDFHYQASLSAYSEQFLVNWINKPKGNEEEPGSLLHRLKDPTFIRQARSGSSNARILRQRDAAILNLSKSYPAILNSFFSQAQCAVGSLGGLSKMSTSLNSSLARGVLSGQSVTFEHVKQLVGERAEHFHRGQCVNPKCACMSDLRAKFGTSIPDEELPYVGECNLCLRCELEYQQNELANQSGSNDEVDGKLDRFSRKMFGNSSAATADYLSEFGVIPGLLPTYFLAEKWVVN